MIALYTFSEEAEPNGSTGKQEPGLLNGQQHLQQYGMLMRYACSEVHRHISK